MIRYCRAIYILLKSAIILTHHSDIKYYQGVSLWIKLWIIICRGGKSNKNLATAIESMGPAYIKIGQFLATRQDILPQDIAQELKKLQDKVPSFPRQKALDIVRQEYGTIDIFTKFSEPIAAASVAQVHFATLENGKEVAVKILRPNIHKKFARDIESFRIGAKILHFMVKRARRLKLPTVIDTLEQWVRDELDLRLEAAAASEFKENLQADDSIYIPQIYWDYTTANILVLERIDGIALTDLKALKESQFDLSKIAATIFRSFLYHATHDGFFHGDLHQGNIIIQNNGVPCLLDFGIIGRLDKQSRRYLAEILYGFVERDYYRIAELHFQAGYVPKHHNIHRFALALRSIGEPIFGKPAHEISMARFLGDLFTITEAFEMETRQELILLQKNLVTVEGTARTLDPNLDIWALISPILENWVKQHLSLKNQIKEKIDIISNRLSHILNE
ncbi:MAG: ubiquinone biosynthesis protein [Alphaproteobacteria bacterium]|jgi:ubiquinone biosynthesis protein